MNIWAYIATIKFSYLLNLVSAIEIVHSDNDNKVLPGNLEIAKPMFMFTGTTHCEVTPCFI